MGTSVVEPPDSGVVRRFVGDKVEGRWANV